MKGFHLYGLLFVALFSSSVLFAVEDSFDVLHGRMSRTVKDIEGTPEDNILLVNLASSVGATESNIGLWQQMLTELKAYIDKNTSWTTSTANKKLFSSVFQDLQRLSDKLFTTITLIYEDLIKDKSPIDVALVNTEVKRLLQPGLAKLEEIKRQLAPKSGDYESTKKIKKILTYFANGLYAMYERTQIDVKKIGVPQRRKRSI